MQRLVQEGYITTTSSSATNDALWLTEAGRQYCLSMIARTRAAEAEAEIQLGQQAATLKQLLKQLVQATHSVEDGRMIRHMDMIGRNIESFGGSDKYRDPSRR